ncbi:hypothetical protein B0H34DRAFT_694800 [Crassisporium funariophilum]|nr:hypothetical protein B0H34DRAFT_694800 [Crassisporium funariophilum]
MYKKHPCRHFDRDGGPLNPPCNQGDNCRFLHPNDPNWIGKTKSWKPSPYGTPEAQTLKHSKALVSQSDLFLRRRNDRFTEGIREKYNRCYSESDQAKVKRNPGSSGQSDRDTCQEFAGDGIARHSRTSTRQTRADCEDIPQSIRDIPYTVRRPGDDDKRKIHPLPRNPFAGEVTNECTSTCSQINPLFQDLARLSRETDDLREVHRKAEAKVKTYNDISATLESISASAAISLAPNLSQAIATQADYKKRIEENEKASQKLWTDMVKTLFGEVTLAIDERLQVALLSISQEAAFVSRSIYGKPDKRQRRDMEGEVTSAEEDKDRSQQRHGAAFDFFSESDFRETKRRKLCSSSPSVAHGLQDLPLDETALVNEMKFKIEQQAEALAILAQENKEV